MAHGGVIFGVRKKSATKKKSRKTRKVGGKGRKKSKGTRRAARKKIRGVRRVPTSASGARSLLAGETVVAAVGGPIFGKVRRV